MKHISVLGHEAFYEMDAKGIKIVLTNAKVNSTIEDNSNAIQIVGRYLVHEGFINLPKSSSGFGGDSDDGDEKIPSY